MRRRLWSVVAFTTFLFFVAPSAAHAADELGVSWDGHVWSEQLSEPMFNPAGRWVPGDFDVKSFYVRNQADDGATLTIAVISVDSDNLLRYEDMRLSARVASGGWVDLERTEENFRLNEDSLPGGEVREVEVRAYFDSDSPNRSQDKELALKFRVTLSDAQIDTEDPDGPGDDDHESTGPLPQTGVAGVGWLIPAAGTAIGVGMALLWMRKRAEADNDRSR